MRAVRSSIAAYLCIGTALVLTLAVTGWGAWRDMVDARRNLLISEVTRLRSHAERTVGRIENDLEARPHTDRLAGLSDPPWLNRFWQEVVPRETQRLYAALVDIDGHVVLHTDPRHRGARLDEPWFIARVPEAGDNVVKTTSPVLAAGQPAFDISIPIHLRGRMVGSYHSGFDAAWLDQAVADRRHELYARWFVLGGLSMLIVLGAGLSLFHLSRRTTALHQALGLARTQQFAELGRLAGALAHEVRNPLNALRMNLHAITHHIRSDAAPEDTRPEIMHIVSESDQEIERLENLIKTILGYARPDRARIEDFDIHEELSSIVEFMGRLIEHDDIRLTTAWADAPIIVRMDRDRFRQALLNLLTNARDAAGPAGHIDIATSIAGDWAEIRVSDNGPGIEEETHGKVFEPFFTTKDSGCGLGLALVKRFIEEAGGAVGLDSSRGRGTTLLIGLPRVTQPAPVPVE